MANVILDDTHLTNIANAIREKNGEATTYTPGAMADAITNLPSGGGVDDSAFILTAQDNNYLFAYNGLENLYNAYKDKLKVRFYNGKYMFFHNKYIKTIDFPIQTIGTTDGGSVYYMFYESVVENIEEGCLINKNNFLWDFNYMFGYARYLRTIPNDLADFFQSYGYRQNDRNFADIFTYCHSLRSIPSGVLATIFDVDSRNYGANIRGFQNCSSLDEIIGMGPIGWSDKYNGFASTFNNCLRLKEIQFTPGLTMNASNQTIDLTYSVGHTSINPSSSTLHTFITNYNSGITTDTEITDDTTYQALKDNPDSWTKDVNYSRYNHDSAVNTINSLPDTSAYIAANGGTNTIKFRGAAGALTDGGAINTLTEEEIAVATAKGWTVSLV